jgi:hypothetical protein
MGALMNEEDRFCNFKAVLKEVLKENLEVRTRYATLPDDYENAVIELWYDDERISWDTL